MSSVSLTGQDTININNRVFADLADGNCIELTFPNEVASVKTGKNGNSLYAFNASGKQCEVKIRTIRGSADDKFMNNLFIQQNANFAGFVLMYGQFIKKVGDGKGNISSDTYVMSGGIFTKGIEGKSNVDGDVDQSVSVWTLKFSNAPRILS